MPGKWQLVLTNCSCGISCHYIIHKEVKSDYTITTCSALQCRRIIICCCQRLSMPGKWQLVLTNSSCGIACHYRIHKQVKSDYTITTCSALQCRRIIICCCQRLAMPGKWQLV